MSRPPFKRMVIGLPQGMGNRLAVRSAAELAAFLQIELSGAFIADAALVEFAGFPGTRELRILERQWGPLDAAMMSRELEQAAELARRRFVECLAGAAATARFEVLSGANLAASLVRDGDIIAIIEPSHPGEAITRQFTALLDAAFATTSAILAVPACLVRTGGPVMAVAGAPEDASIRVGLQIAAALKERLIVAVPPGVELSAGLVADAAQLGIAVERVVANSPGADVPSLLRSLSQSAERLRVITRHGLERMPELFSLLHGVPLLAVESEPKAAESSAVRPAASHTRQSR